jgi:outer membrane biosynthesis protein TonB
MLDATVLEALKEWRYRPHYENGKPVEAKTQIVVEFSISLQ